jgi:hypothetical protein
MARNAWLYGLLLVLGFFGLTATSVAMGVWAGQRLAQRKSADPARSLA